MHYGHVVDSATGRIVDEVLVLLMRSPHSYTAEDVVEIDCHGGSLVVQRIMELLLDAGARPAEPGEFTKRAFLNGRIDLSQAESVMDVIHSKNDFAFDSSMKQLHGAVKKKIVELREQILHETAFIEAALDDPEHYELENYGATLLPVVEGLCDEIKEMLRNSNNGRILSEGIKTVIVGKPNAGKSSLMNLLLGSEYAIVTDVAGTTRDVLEKDFNLDGITLHIVDTAGIRDTEDVVEKIGVERARKSVDEADLILYVIDSSGALDESDRQILSLIQEKKVIVLLNKCDLTPVITEKMLADELGAPVVPCSAKYGDGLRELTEQIKSMFFQGEVTYNDEVYLTNLRHKECIQHAYHSLLLVKESIENQVPEDFYTVDLLNAYEQLGLIIGESVTDDLVDKIFHEFCMGK
jgi:tRNA modification GTPase